jgi:hypothetical protein
MIYSVKGPATKWTKRVLFPEGTIWSSESYPVSLDVMRMDGQGAHPPSSNAWIYMSTFPIYHCLVLKLCKGQCVLSSITNKMQRYTIFFTIVNALHISGGWHTSDAVCVQFLSSWCWAEKPPETCRTVTIIKHILDFKFKFSPCLQM